MSSTVFAAFIRRFTAVLAVLLCVLGTPMVFGTAHAGGRDRQLLDGVHQIGYAVYDRQKRSFRATRNAHVRFRSASVVKLLIVLDELLRNHPVLILEQAKTDAQRLEVLSLREMLRGSWDYAASVYWANNGFNDVVNRMVPLIGLTDTAPPANPRIWGYTSTSAADVVRIYNYIIDKAPPEYRAFILDNIYAASRCADDGRDQSFGLPGVAARPWGVKQGWSGWPTEVPPGDRCLENAGGGFFGQFGGPAPAMKELPADLASPMLATTGVLGPHQRTVVAVFATYSGGISWKRASAQMTRMSKSLVRTKDSR
ncbi:hypothetical protein [Pseudonocardia spinosispora]|uniref:hypothetical protein n=1 Tax=Pseudonocardia spinosispora TaxID=103441 RepID=UPI0012EBBC96|nr:hypothetical protein [Pseudonocardia spinosispora]